MAWSSRRVCRAASALSLDGDGLWVVEQVGSSRMREWELDWWRLKSARAVVMSGLQAEKRDCRDEWRVGSRSSARMSSGGIWREEDGDDSVRIINDGAGGVCEAG